MYEFQTIVDPLYSPTTAKFCELDTATNLPCPYVIEVHSSNVESPPAGMFAAVQEIPSVLNAALLPALLIATYTPPPYAISCQSVFAGSVDQPLPPSN